jgi:fumarate reductase subunit C
MTLPMTFKEFAKNPIVATLFLVLLAISYLYIDVRTTFKDQITMQNVKVEKLDDKVDVMQVALRRCDSSLAAATAKLSTLESLGKIQAIK